MAEASERQEPIGARLRRRLRRVSLRRLQPAALPWVLLCWVISIAAIVVLLWPGALEVISAKQVPIVEGLTSFDPPGWFRSIVLLAAAVFAGAAVVISRTEHEDGPKALRRFVDEVIVALAVVLPFAMLLADQAWLFAVAAALLGGAAEFIRRGPRAVPGVLAAGAWLVVLGYQFTLAGRLPTSWVWVAMFGFAAAVAAFGAYYGVARAAETRTRAIRVLFRERWNRWIVLLVAVVAAVLVVLRLTVLRELFPPPDPELWAPWSRNWTSWLFAALVVGVLVVVSIRSARKPLLRVGQRRVTAGLAVLGNLNLFFGGLLVALALGMAVIGQVALPAQEDWDPVIRWLKFAGVALLGLAMFLPALRGTAARWLGIVAALFLLPNTFAAAMRENVPEAFAPSPVQVCLLLVAVALVMAIMNAVRPFRRPSLIARFAAVPLIAVHAGWLLPAVWTQFGLAVGVVIALVTLLLLQPPAARDNATHTVRMMTSSASQLLAFGVAMVAAPSLLDDPGLIVLGLVWLSVVVVAALCFETVERDPEPVVYTDEPVIPQPVANLSRSA